jgi:hypothetical protein
MRELKIAVILGTLSFMMVGYQNCGRLEASSGATEVSNSGGATVDPAQTQAGGTSGIEHAFSDSQLKVLAAGATSAATGASSPDYPPDSTFRDPYTPSELPPFSCARVEAIAAPTDGSPLHVPARDASGTCYAMKLVQAVSYNPSNQNSVIDRDVISRNHDLKNYTADDVHNPYVLGKSALRLYLEGERSLKLAGGLSATAPIQVDNFILVGLAPTKQFGNPFYYLAYGTSDATVHGTSGVLFNNENVNLTAYAVGGTSQVPPISLDNKISSAVDYTLDVRALDCGGIGVVSDLYVLFQ